MRHVTRYDALCEMHNRLEAAISAETERPLPDAMVLQRLKRERLALKEKIHYREKLHHAMRDRQRPIGSRPQGGSGGILNA